MHFIDAILNIIYPNVCGMCNKICKADICTKCMSKLNSKKDCKRHIYLSKNFTYHMHIFPYDESIRKNIIQYKFSDQAYRYKSFVKFMLKDKKICGFLKKYDIIIPVPISKERKIQRGYNQSELIVKEIAKNIPNINIGTDILYKIKNTPQQSSLNKEQRKYNLIDAYEVRNVEKIKNKKILLFDDIYTTGSTVEECSKILKLSGAYEIGVLTLAKD